MPPRLGFGRSCQIGQRSREAVGNLRLRRVNPTVSPRRRACLAGRPGGKLAGLCCREEIMTEPVGLARGLTNYGDPDFALYLRRSFARSMGYSIEHAGAAGDRHRRHAFRLQQLPPPFPRADRGGEARRAGGGRAAAGVPDDLAGRGVPQPDQPDVPQPDGDRHRGDDPRPADGRGGAGRRLRQDRAGAADGRDLGQPAGDPAGRRADDDLALARRAARRLHRLPALLGANTAPARSTPTRSTRSRATSRPPPAPAR